MTSLLFGNQLRVSDAVLVRDALFTVHTKALFHNTLYTSRFVLCTVFSPIRQLDTKWENDIFNDILSSLLYSTHTALHSALTCQFGSCGRDHALIVSCSCKASKTTKNQRTDTAHPVICGTGTLVMRFSLIEETPYIITEDMRRMNTSCFKLAAAFMQR